jgi:hypothetical protein
MIDQLIILGYYEWWVWTLIAFASIPVCMIAYNIGKMGIKVLSILFNNIFKK